MEISSIKPYMIAALIGLGVSLSACKKEEPTSLEKASDSVKDGLNMRENEKLKDAGEDMKDAAENAGDAVKEKAEDTKDAVTK